MRNDHDRNTQRLRAGRVARLVTLALIADRHSDALIDGLIDELERIEPRQPHPPGPPHLRLVR